MVGYHVYARWCRWRRINLAFMSWRSRWSSCWCSVRQRVNQEACRVVETMWMQDVELAWKKLEEQVYTVEKMQEVNLKSKFMTWGISTIPRKWKCTYRYGSCPYSFYLDKWFWEHGNHYKRDMMSCVFHKTLAIIIEEWWNLLDVFLDRVEQMLKN